jgi:hypothetical protein
VLPRRDVAAGECESAALKGCDGASGVRQQLQLHAVLEGKCEEGPHADKWRAEGVGGTVASAVNSLK